MVSSPALAAPYAVLPAHHAGAATCVTLPPPSRPATTHLPPLQSAAAADSARHTVRRGMASGALRLRSPSLSSDLQVHSGGVDSARAPFCWMQATPAPATLIPAFAGFLRIERVLRRICDSLLLMIYHDIKKIGIRVAAAHVNQL